MIFPTEAVREVRTHVEEQVSAGKITETEAYRRALQVDPEDPYALRELAMESEEKGDFAAARELAWRWLRADPLAPEVFLLMGRLLARDPAEAARADAYDVLGREKSNFQISHQPGSIFRPDENEPEAVARELEPHRLLHKMWVATSDPIARDVVERMLARSGDMVPLLLGVLNLHGEELLDEMDGPLVARSIALLGEIGELAFIPILIGFIGGEDESLGEAAQWAMQRIAFRGPAEVLGELRRMIPSAVAADLSIIARQLSMMPQVQGREEALRAIERRMPEFDGTDVPGIRLALIASGWIMQGVDGPLAKELEERHLSKLPPELRDQVKDVNNALRDEGPYVAEPEDSTIYDVCCQGFEVIDEDEAEDQPVIRTAPKVGRNDPCWCGSGKKYKKCHLAADERR